jgi:uncharacterized membrane protein
MAAIAGLVGLAVAIALGAGWAEAVLGAWVAAAVVYLALVWHDIALKDADATKALSQSEDDSRAASESVLLGGSVASLVAVVFTLAHAGHDTGAARVATTLFALVSVALAWACVHTVYTLRYARLYYAPPVGGIDYPDDDPPDYRDFAYLAFTVGMTYQVSDTDLSIKPTRRAVLQHALLSYLFGAVILAVAINAVAGLLGR